MPPVWTIAAMQKCWQDKLGLVTPALAGIAVRAVDRLEFFQRPAGTHGDAR
jgi:hypothetical protein